MGRQQRGARDERINRWCDRGEKRGRVVPLESAGVAGKSSSQVLSRTPVSRRISTVYQHKPPSENTE